MNECMRTNIVLNDELLREAQRYSRARSKTELVEEALRTLVEVRSAIERRRSYELRLRDVQRATTELKFRESALDLLRADRDHE